MSAFNGDRAPASGNLRRGEIDVRTVCNARGLAVCLSHILRSSFCLLNSRHSYFPLDRKVGFTVSRRNSYYTGMPIASVIEILLAIRSKRSRGAYLSYASDSSP